MHLESKAFLVQVSFTLKAKTSLTLGPFTTRSSKIDGRSSSAASAVVSLREMGCEGSKEPASVALATRVGCDSSAAATELRLARVATKVPEAGFS